MILQAFVPAVACHFCLHLTAVFMQPGASTLSDLCIINVTYNKAGSSSHALQQSRCQAGSRAHVHPIFTLFLPRYKPNDLDQMAAETKFSKSESVNYRKTTFLYFSPCMFAAPMHASPPHRTEFVSCFPKSDRADGSICFEVCLRPRRSKVHQDRSVHSQGLPCLFKGAWACTYDVCSEGFCQILTKGREVALIWY